MQKESFRNLEVSLEQAEQYAQTYFGIKAKASKLPGEVDFNFYMQSKEDASEYTLKISRPETAVEELAFQTAIMKHLEQQQLPFEIPTTVYTKNGKPYKKIADQDRWIRLQKWVPGSMLGEVNPRTKEVLKNWGETAAHLVKALQGFDHPTAHRFYKWNPSETLYSKKYLPYIFSVEQQEIAKYFWQLFEENTLPQLPHLRKGINHNDAHEQNLLVNKDLRNPKISGLIDFGDALFTETINELAIACAYACMRQADPLEAATFVIKGFHEVFPLEEKEVELLYALIAARLLITAANAAWNKHNEPDNEYLSISEKPAWDLLKKWKTISPQLAHYTFRAACGWQPCPMHETFQNWIANFENTFALIIDLKNKKTIPFDLSVGSLDLGNNTNFDTIKAFNRTVDRLLEDQDAQIGVGGYGEIRPFYTTDAYQIEGNSGADWRTLHLGLDLWTADETPIFAPLAGSVHSFANNKGDCDYGPTIILEHRISEELTFYTLYGHLTEDSLDGLEDGMTISKGQQVAKIGAPPINGNWPPHLHFQILLDTLGNKGDFPGVAYPSAKKTWLSICPNPALLIPELIQVGKKEVKTTAAIQQTRNQNLGKSLSISYEQPLQMVRGFGQYLYDQNARRYLDTVNNVAHVGHEHPKVVRAAQRQIGLLNTNTRYLHENITTFAEELLATFPPALAVVHFVNSGSEANELALRMAETYTGQKDMLAIEAAYHGNTGGCINISSYKFDGKGGKGAPPNTHVLPMPDVYRGACKNPKTAGKYYAEFAQKAIDEIQKEGRNVAGFIAESILSCGGQIMLPQNYLANIYKTVRAAGGLCIADEVQVGFGRTGEKMWAFELQNVIPDIVTLGKPIGNGHPLAAVVTTAEVAQQFANGMEYFNTFGGNPVSCVIGRTVLEVIKEEGLQENAQQVGKYLKTNLEELQKKHPIIGDVRGLGFFLGFELIKNTATLEPAKEAATYLTNRMRQRGMLMSTDGPLHNVIKIKPPMCFTKANVDFLVENLDKILGEDFMQIEGI